MATQPTQAGFISSDNSTSSTLLASAAFTGTAEDVTGYASVSVFVFASHTSATDGLKMQWSSDGTNWDEQDAYTIPATTGKTYTAGVQARYFRVTYTNGGTNQTSFRLQTLYHNTTPKASSHRIGDTLTAENDAELAMAVNVAKRTSGTFSPVASTNHDAMLMWPYQVRGSMGTAYVTLSTNTETTLVAGSAGELRDILYVKATTNTTVTGPDPLRIDLRSGTGGSIIHTFGAGNGGETSLPIPLLMTEAGQPWTVKFNNTDVSNTSAQITAIFIKTT